MLPFGLQVGRCAPDGRRRWRALGVLLVRGSIVLAFVAMLCWLVLLLLVRLVSMPEALFNRLPEVTEYVDRNGQPLRMAPPGEEQFRRGVAFSEIPSGLVHATLAAEDRRFWKHRGVDSRATARAAWQLVRNRRIVSGGSTITQQLVKLAQPKARTFRSKILEALQAYRLEQLWDKQRILAEYLNRVEYGNHNRGCAMAARFYFGKPLRDLSPAECALLAGLPQAPTRLNPLVRFERAKKRQQWILASMRQCGWLTEAEYARARQEVLRLVRQPRVFRAPHFVDLVMQQAAAQGAARTNVVRTTLDLALNDVVERTLREHLADLEDRDVRNAAAVVIENRTGEVLALVGSEDYFNPRSGQVNGAWAPRSAGSAFKPFTYLLAFEKGATPATVIADVPAEFATATGLFAPVNYDRRCHGPVRCRVALANSLNIPAVKALGMCGGPEALQTFLRDCGLTTLTELPDHYGLGLTIGNAEARLLELANAYACLGRLGEHRPPALILRAAANVPARRVADRASAFLVADILSDNNARALAFGADSPLRFAFPVACKTGTSSSFRDNWAFGYTPEFTVGVWAGNFDGTPMRNVSGVTGAGPMLHAIFEHLHRERGTSWYEAPEEVSEVWIHPLTGKALRDQGREEPSGNAVLEKFHREHSPGPEQPEDYDERGRVRLGCEYRDWLETNDNWLGDRATLDCNGEVVRILFPPAGTVVYLDPDLPESGRRLRLDAVGPGARIDWRSDTLEIIREGPRFIALLSPGKHRLAVRDSVTGQEAQTWVEVRKR